jgi:hypothetical protein
MRRALVVVALLVSACAGTPEPVSSPDLCGSWRNAEGTTLTFEDTGVMLLQLPGPKQRPTVGAYTFDGTQATFRDQTGSGACSDSVGTYTVRVTADSFEASAARESCAERKKALEGSWTRTAAGRVTPGS